MLAVITVKLFLICRPLQCFDVHRCTGNNITPEIALAVLLLMVVIMLKFDLESQ